MRPPALAFARRKLRGCALIVATVALFGCDLSNPGDEPPRATLYFPTAMVLSPHAEGEAARYLFVANSNFDLRYKAGTVQAFSLDELEARIAECDGDPECVVPTARVLEDEVMIGSFATSLAFAAAPAAAPDAEEFVFVTTRTDDNLVFIQADVEADGDRVLRCADEHRRCGEQAERGLDPETAADTLDWPADPAAVITGVLADLSSAASDAQRYALVAHRGGHVSLFIEDPAADPDSSERFVLSDVLSGLPAPLTNVAFDPSTQLAHLTGGLRIGRVGLAPDITNTGPSGVGDRLYSAQTLDLTASPGRADTHDIEFLAGISGAGEALANDSALLVSQEPSALLLVDVDETRNPPNSARVKRSAVVGAGASRVATGLLRGRPIAVVACFIARALFVVDLETMLTRSVVPNLSGPFEIILDEARELVYAADFRSSVIRVVDLSELADTQGEVSARVVATLGKTRVLQELR